MIYRVSREQFASESDHPTRMSRADRGHVGLLNGRERGICSFTSLLIVRHDVQPQRHTQRCSCSQNLPQRTILRKGWAGTQHCRPRSPPDIVPHRDWSRHRLMRPRTIRPCSLPPRCATVPCSQARSTHTQTICFSSLRINPLPRPFTPALFIPPNPSLSSRMTTTAPSSSHLPPPALPSFSHLPPSPSVLPSSKFTAYPAVPISPDFRLLPCQTGLSCIQTPPVPLLA